ncbi:hypothetical protein X770_03830 [Mesorhizobium sp. LSJC269B00]|uniref:hypothetical protein n=1 Tax=Mesorhizobium sp. LSJC269B00 TaxID=1287326 RepID=UPI0003CED4C8|nr:hypothetical protein [Mesorhizobium sp. LSJC269B00]ESW93878.1 hypothetical protein X770_03830 [Mesorhizobium sp. LSJC269B00]
MINLRPLRDQMGAPSKLAAPASILAAIMTLAKGFARDGIGASLLGFEIFVRWTSFRGGPFILVFWYDQIALVCSNDEW